MGHVDAAVWLAAGYGVFLLAAAFGVDRMARRAAARTAAWHQGGFTYHADHDAWLCPQDQWLWPRSFDPDNRVLRYRASPAVCNACPVKSTCTSSDHGRQVNRNVDPWPASEAERFHRGIACTVAVLGLLWPTGMLLGARRPAEVLVLGVTVLLVAAGSLPLWTHLHRSPAGFPVPVGTETLDETVAGRSAPPPPPRYRSDHRTTGRPHEHPTDVHRRRNR